MESAKLPHSRPIKRHHVSWFLSYSSALDGGEGSTHAVTPTHTQALLEEGKLSAPQAGDAPSGMGMTLRSLRCRLGTSVSRTSLLSLCTGGRVKVISFLCRIFRNPTCSRGGQGTEVPSLSVSPWVHQGAPLMILWALHLLP